MTYALSIVVPSYNEVKSLPSLIKRYNAARKNVNFQLVIVDNGSSDGTDKYLKKAVKVHKWIKITRVNKNIGYGNGIHIGLNCCDGDIIGWSHADLQCPPEDVFRGYRLYKRISKKAFVKGYRRGRNWKSLILTYGFAIYSSLVLLSFFDDINGQPKIFHRDLLKTFKNPPKGFSYDLYAQYKAIRNNYKVYSFPVIFKDREFGLSKWAYSIFSKLATIRGFLKDAVKMRLGIIR